MAPLPDQRIGPSKLSPDTEQVKVTFACTEELVSKLLPLRGKLRDVKRELLTPLLELLCRDTMPL